jgi:hypothetical protein
VPDVEKALAVAITDGNAERHPSVKRVAGRTRGSCRVELCFFGPTQERDSRNDMIFVEEKIAWVIVQAE